MPVAADGPEPLASQFRLDFSGRAPLDRAAAVRAELDATPEAAHGRRAMLEAVLVGAVTGTDPSEAAAAALRAESEAIAAGDATSRAWALLARICADLSPSTVASRVSASRELLALLRGGTLPQLAPTAYFLLLGSLAESGDVAGLDVELSEQGPTLLAFPELAEGRHATWYRCSRATIDGRTSTAEGLAVAGLAAARAAEDPDAESVFAGQIAILRWMQGRAAELEPTFLLGRQHHPGEPVWSAGLAWIWLHQGRESAARGLVRSLPPPSTYPRDRNWLAAVTILGAVVAQLGERPLVTELRELLEPFEDRLATIGLGVTLWGTVARSLALLAIASGDDDAAAAHYSRAIEVCSRTGAQAWLAEAQIELARLLARRAGPGDTERARRLADEALSTGRSLMLHGVEDAAARLRAALTPVELLAARSDASTPPRVEVLGGFRVVGLDGTVARWQSRKARELLKVLVARRGTAIDRESLMDLLWPDEAPARVANRFSVAATTVRRALDPGRQQPRDAFLETTGNLVRLNLERLEVDSELFLRNAESAVAMSPSAPARDRLETLRDTLDLFRGEAFVCEPEARWAERLRREVHLAFFAVAHALGEVAEELDDQVTRVRAYREIVAIDAFDQRAHAHLVDALEALGAHQQATEARETFADRMAELGLGSLALR